MWIYKLVCVFILAALTVNASICAFPGPWSSCDSDCYGKRTRTCSIVVLDWTDSESCNQDCKYGYPYKDGGCRCSNWRTGRCCEGCSNSGIDHCKPRMYECGGSPDGIRCTDCYLPFMTGGFNKGCVRKPCNENNGGCSHRCSAVGGLTNCTCLAGYQLSYDEYSCVDIDECWTGVSACSQICINSNGTYHCECEAGFYLDNDTVSCISERYYEGDITTWQNVTCNLGEPQLKYNNTLFEVNETLANSDDVWIGYIYAKVPLLLLGCASLHSENGVYVNHIGDCFTICGGGPFGVKRTIHEQSNLLCSCDLENMDTTETSCTVSDQNSLCDRCYEIYTQINVNASNVGDPGESPEGDCLTYFYPHFKWQMCTRRDYIRSMCSNSTYKVSTASATIENTTTFEWWAGNKLCLTNGQHPSFESSITNSGFSNPQAQYYWTGIFRENILIKISLKDTFTRFSNESYLYVQNGSTILWNATDSDKKRALCVKGYDSTSRLPETPTYSTADIPSITQSKYSETSVVLTKATTPDASTTYGSTSTLATTQVYTTLATDSALSASNNGPGSPALAIGLSVSVGILVCVGGTIVIVLLKRRGILHCNRNTENNKPSENETSFRENMTYGKNNEENVAHQNYFILEKCGQSISSNAEHCNESNDVNTEDNYNTIHEAEEPYEHVKDESSDYDHTTNALTSGSDAKNPENVYNKLKIDRARDNGHGQRNGQSVVQSSEDDYDTTSAVVSHGMNDDCDYDHIPRTAYKSYATGDNIKGDEGGNYDAINNVKFKVAQSDRSDYAHVNKDHIT